MYQKVLVPLDGSELAECALDHVRVMVKAGVAGEVTLLKVVKIDIPADALYGSELRYQRDAGISLRLGEEVSCRCGIPPQRRGDRSKKGGDRGHATCRRHHGVCPKKRHSDDCHRHARVYRHEKADVGQRGSECSPRFPCAGAFDQAGGVSVIRKG